MYVTHLVPLGQNLASKERMLNVCLQYGDVAQIYDHVEISFQI